MNVLFIVALFMCYSETPLYCIMWNFIKRKRRKDIHYASFMPKGRRFTEIRKLRVYNECIKIVYKVTLQFNIQRGSLQ